MDCGADGRELQEKRGQLFVPERIHGLSETKQAPSVAVRAFQAVRTTWMQTASRKRRKDEYTGAR